MIKSMDRGDCSTILYIRGVDPASRCRGSDARRYWYIEKGDSYAVKNFRFN